MKTRGSKRQVSGVIVSNKMDKTVVVQVERFVMHPLYKKYIRRRNKFTAHDQNNSCQIGDRVEISESRPLSKTKRWRVSRILQKAV
jgi:small subunit ribosomal protein S17